MMSTRERLREVLCRSSSCTNDIHECTGRLKHRCLELGTSFIDNLNVDQLNYITSGTDKNIFLKACPGSGKTEVLGIKSAYEINSWENKLS